LLKENHSFFFYYKMKEKQSSMALENSVDMGKGKNAKY